MRIPRWLRRLSLTSLPFFFILTSSITIEDHESRSFFLHYSRQTPSEAFLRDLSSPPTLSPSSQKRGLASQPLLQKKSAPLLPPCTDLYRFICEGQSHLEDPTGTLETAITGEQAAQKLLERIRKDHPEWSEAALQEKLSDTIFNPTQHQRIQKAFVWVKREMLQFFAQQPDSILSIAEKEKLKSFLRDTTLEIPPPAQVYRDHMELLMSDDVFYEKTEQGRRLLKVGGGYVLIYQSWFNLIFTLAHELAHSVDICEIKDDGLSFPAFDRLNACFIEQQLVALTPQRKECIAHDHLAEVFADWIAVQITSRALQTFKQEHPKAPLENAIRNSVRDLCSRTHYEPKEERGENLESPAHKEQPTPLPETPPNHPEESEFHPTAEVRVEKLFAQHPIIRALLGCPAPAVNSKASFCTWTHPSPPPSEAHPKTSFPLQLDGLTQLD